MATRRLIILRSHPGDSRAIQSERLLFRLSKSEFADRFILKGAALLVTWLGEPIRPTKDIDLLGFGDTSAEALKRVFVQLCAVGHRTTA